MLDRQCPRVVETREPATETTLEDVLARNLSTPRTRACVVFTTPACLYLYSTRQYVAWRCSPPLRGRARICLLP